MDSRIYAVWFHKVFGTSVCGRKLLSRFASPGGIYKAYAGGELKDISLPAAISGFSLVPAHEILKICEYKGYEIIEKSSPFYPPLLKSVPDAPYILFAHGKKEVLGNDGAFAVVGSRKAAPEGLKTAYETARRLAMCGALIISGGAEGIDSEAHRGAIDGGGSTVLVAGCGLGNSYMKKTGGLYDEIKENGVIITEMFPGEAASRFSFPKRNRLIAGISRAVIVSAAQEKSGALITADCAHKYKRRIYVPDMSLMSSPGTDMLLSSGAAPYICADDILAPTGFVPPEGTSGSMRFSPVKVSPEEDAPETGNERKIPCASGNKIHGDDGISGLSDDLRAVYEAVGSEILYTDDICKKTELSAVLVMEALTELELMNLVEIFPGGRVSKK